MLLEISVYFINSLQRVQNCAARVATGSSKKDRITPIIFRLLWLPIRCRSLYKILFYTYNVPNTSAPVSFTDLIQTCKPTRLLRSEFDCAQDMDCKVQEEIRESMVYAVFLKPACLRTFSLCFPILKSCWGL